MRNEGLYGACLVNLTKNPWYNLAASIVIDGILAADFRFLNSELGEFLRDSIGLTSSPEYFIKIARSRGMLYEQRPIRKRKGGGVA